MGKYDKKKNKFSDLDSSLSSVKSVDSKNRSFRHSTPKKRKSDPLPSSSRGIMESCENCKSLERKIEYQTLAIEEIKLTTRKIYSSISKMVDDKIESQLRITTVKPIDAKKVAENELTNKIIEKRANPKWRKNLEKLVIDGLMDEQIVKLQEIYRGRVTKPSKLSLDIARVLWKKDFICQHIIGPTSNSNRLKDRKKILPYDEEEKLKSALEVFSSTFMRDNEWHWFVRDPINQATRDPRTNWTREDDDSISALLDPVEDDFLNLEKSSKRQDHKKDTDEKDKSSHDKSKSDKKRNRKDHDEERSEKEKEKSINEKSKPDNSRKSKEDDKDKSDNESVKSNRGKPKSNKNKNAKDDEDASDQDKTHDSEKE